MKKWIEINDRSAIAAIRRLARRYASGMGLTETRLDALGIVVTEATTNILRYAERGRALIEVIEGAGVRKIALVFADHGPGISDMDRMMQDGNSSVASSGLGLGSIRRLSDSFDIYSVPGEGTTITCTFAVQDTPPYAGSLAIDGLRVCHPASNHCGDDLMVRPGPGHTDLMLCDGLGHGQRAAEASAEIVETARRLHLPPSESIAHLSREMVGHRGAVAAMARIDHATGQLDHSGLGNITTFCLGSETRKRLAVRDGRIGGAPTQGFDEQVMLKPGDLVVMHTDGLKTLGDKDLPPALLARSPMLICGHLLDRAFRGRDDAGILVARWLGGVAA
ncbi:ATP-binding protein [Lutimaribacter marinistellae]|uniref:ATP-binding protein n=1 Tax=Lutimaribacter marinistellae TaxID=1820329 RepID=A0ABV7TCH4_9RHOB